MKRRNNIFVVMMTGVLLLSGCGGTDSGISQRDYDKVTKERDELKEELEEKDETISELNKQIEELEAQIKESTNPIRPEKTEPETKEIDVDTSKSDATPDTGAATEESVEILAEYTLSDSIGWYTRHFMIVKNNSSKAMNIKTSSLAYDKNGNLVGAADGEFDVLGSGCTSCFYEAFETSEEIDHYETTLKANESNYYQSVIEYLDAEINNISNGAVVKVTNNGDKTAEFVEGMALFFKNGELVEFETSYYTDDDFELKPGETISQQFTSYNDFDTIEFYLDGRR